MCPVIVYTRVRRPWARRPRICRGQWYTLTVWRVTFDSQDFMAPCSFETSRSQCTWQHLAKRTLPSAPLTSPRFTSMFITSITCAPTCMATHMAQANTVCRAAMHDKAVSFYELTIGWPLLRMPNARCVATSTIHPCVATSDLEACGVCTSGRPLQGMAERNRWP